jgi:hypothetical protein
MKYVVVCSVLMLAAASAQAQNPGAAAPENPTVPMAPQNAPAAPPERIAPHPGVAAPSPRADSGTLSDQLSKKQGTVAPPNVDPGMTVGPSTGSAGRMPVIPPPGSPGGNSSVVPK